jgi:hypothetical protein
MMRRLLVLFALLGLLYSPAAAVAAQKTCADSGMPMAGMTMAEPDNGKAASAAEDPCCDHGQKAPDNKSCVQACAVMCGVVCALPTPIVFVPPSARALPIPEAVTALKAHPPPRAERPPRSIT